MRTYTIIGDFSCVIAAVVIHTSDETWAKLMRDVEFASVQNFDYVMFQLAGTARDAETGEVLRGFELDYAIFGQARVLVNALQEVTVCQRRPS